MAAAPPEQLRWGILGTGGICNNFAVSLVKNGSSIAAVGASTLEKAELFREKFGAGRAHGSYESLVQDSDVDVVYIGTINTMHLQHAKLALEAGKHVLCEKPLGVNLAQTKELVDLARAKKLFLMEALWTRFFPATRHAKKMIDSGDLGAPVYVQADFGFKGPTDKEHRLWDPAMAGGALLDIGCYLVQCGTWVFGAEAPSRIACTGQLAASGVDSDGSMSLAWSQGMASCLYSITANTPEITTVICEQGVVRLLSPGHTPTQLSFGKELSRGVYEEEQQDFPLPEAPPGLQPKRPIYMGMLYEIEEVERCILAGLTECPEMTLDESLAIAVTLQECRRQVGVTFPFE